MTHKLVIGDIFLIQLNLITKTASGTLVSADMKHLSWSNFALFAEDTMELNFVAVVFQRWGGLLG